MTPWNANRLSSSSSSISGTSGTSGMSGISGPPSKPVPSRWASLVARMRASTWASVVARVGAVVVALVVLGWIGRTAAAGPTTPTSAGGSDLDASTSALPAFLTPAAIDGGSSIVGASAMAATTTTPASAAAATTTTAASAPHGRATATEPVYLNQASVDELRRLPGVGPKRAEAILVLRQRLGRFQRVEDLLRVKGVGRGAVKKWRPLVRLDAPPAGAPDGGST